MTEINQQEAQAPALPFEPITVLIGILRRWKIFAAIVTVFAVAAVFLATQFGTRIYEAATVLLYKGSDGKGNPEETYSLSLPLNTQIHMVKLPSNLEKVREKLGLSTSIKALGRACRVSVEKRTSLVTISARWDSAETVAAVVNTVRDVFLENQVKLAKENARKQLVDLEKRFRKVTEELKAADAKLQAFISENKIVDLEKEIQWNLEQITSLQLLLSNAKVEKDTLEAQKSVLDNRIAVIKQKIAQEKTVASRDQSLADLNIRIERLRRAIHDDKVQRENKVELAKYKLAYDRAKKLYEKGLISKADLEEAKADYERQEVKTIDTEQVEEWKRQLKILEKQVVPPKEEFQSPSQQLLQDLQLKSLDLELQSLSLKQKIAHLNHEIERVESRLGVLTDLQRKYVELNREVTARENEKMSLEKQLATVKRIYESDTSDFIVISEAKVPIFSVKSNRKIIFAVVLVLGVMIGFTTIFGLEFLDTTIKSGAELHHKFSLPVLGVVPKSKNPRELFPDAERFEMIELFRIVSRHLRHDVPKKGARILITSADRWEGKTCITANLAACFGRQDERVLVMDTQLRPIESERDLRYLIAERDKPIRGLAEYLTFGADSVEEITWPTVLPGVECIPRMEESIPPDLLASIRMQELLQELSERFSIILIDGPSMANYVDAELVAQSSDAVIFVVRSRYCQSSLLKDAVERIKISDVPIIRFIINDVDRLYIKRA